MHSSFKNFSRLALPVMLVFFSLHDCNAQKFLAMDKSGNRLRFYVNDEINVRLKNEKFYRSGNIRDFTDSSFFLSGSYILLTDVDAIRVRKKTGGQALLRRANVMLPIGGVFLLGVTAGNSLINNHHPLIPKSMYYVSGGIAAAGLMLYPFTFRVYRMKRHPLKIIDVSFSKN